MLGCGDDKDVAERRMIGVGAKGHFAHSGGCDDAVRTDRAWPFFEKSRLAPSRILLAVWAVMGLGVFDMTKFGRERLVFCWERMAAPDGEAGRALQDGPAHPSCSPSRGGE